VFEAQGLEPAFADGTLLVKRLAGLPGDLVEVTAAGVRVNGQLLADGLALAGKLGHAAADFTRHYRVPQGQFLALGTDPSSLDGRYYGPLPQSRIRGRARVLF
jgi:conjugal transfer pilin signal peptidase TrbI